MKKIFLVLVVVSWLTPCLAQQASSPKDPAAALRQMNESGVAVHKGDTASLERQDYQIGVEDLLDISVFEVPELSRTVRVSAGGEISLPLLGLVKVAGLSPQQLEEVLREMLRKTYLKDPQVAVFVKEFHSAPVSVVGAVKVPGLYHIQTQKSLIEVLAMAQGLADGPQRLPGRTIIISRKRRPAGTPGLDSEADGGGAASPERESGSVEIVEVPVVDLLQSGDPKWNPPIYPGDVVKVVPAGTVYVVGAVNKPGGFPLSDYENVSAIQALALAGGTSRAASKKGAVIIRIDRAGKRSEQKIDLGRVLSGKDNDLKLGPNDILFVPPSTGKAAALRSLEAAISTVSALTIYRF